MKTIAFSVVFLLTSMSFASATCPPQSQKVATCVSTPKAGDHEIAAGVFDSIAICTQGSKTILVPEKNGESEGLEAKVTARMGGTTYLVKSADVDFALSVTTGIRSRTSPAQFKVDFKSVKIVASSTYTCTR